jgi:ribonuclease P protein component
MADEKSLLIDVQKAEKRSRHKLPKDEIIRDKKRISYLLNHSQNTRAIYDGVTLVAEPHDKMEMAIVLKKSIGKACLRNHYKRIIREAYRNTKSHVKKPYAMLFIINSPPKQLTYKNMKKFLLEVFKTHDGNY